MLSHATFLESYQYLGNNQLYVVLHSLFVKQEEPVSVRPSPYTMFDFNSPSSVKALLCMLTQTFKYQKLKLFINMAIYKYTLYA